MDFKLLLSVLGSIIMLLCHWHLTILAFEKKFRTGIICLVIPCYSVIHAFGMETREANLGLKGFGLGFLMVLIGEIVM